LRQLGREKIELQWRFKGVTPILYSSKNEHKQLHKTISEWDRIKNNLGRKRVIAQYSSIDSTALKGSPDTKHIISWVL
jgi:hypothetical protein